MKTTTKLLLVFFISTFNLFAQDSHHEMEHLFENKSLVSFEVQLGLLATDYLNQPLIDFVDAQYQSFHAGIHNRIDNGEDISHAQFEIEYENLILSTQNQFAGISLLKQPPMNGGTKVMDGPCVNMDFETGDFTGWTLTRGDVDGSAPFSFIGEFGVGPGPYHTIYGGGFDPICGIPMVDPLGGGFSARIGNGTGVGARAARLKQTFLVDATNYMFNYSYAVVFESPNGHALNELPYFTVRVFDSLGNSIPCGEYSAIADAVSAPDYESIVVGGTTVLYKNWSSVFTNLLAYIGQNVTVEFTAGDCSLTGHYGYAYVDASCGIETLTASNDIICPGDSSLLSAPAGLASYLWSNGATTQSTWVYAGGLYTCLLTPFQGGACDILLDITINENPAPTANFTANSFVACVGIPVDFSDLSTIPLPGVIVAYRWDFGNGIITPLSNGPIVAVPNTSGTYTAPSHIYLAPGVYNVELYVVSADGCSDSITIPVTINALPIVVAGPDQTVCEGTAVTLSGAGAVFYSWNNGVTDDVPFVPAVGTLTYTVIGTDANGCINTDQVDVTVNTLPVVNAGLDQTVCEGTAVTLSGSGAVLYAWDNGITDGVPFVPAVGTLTYTVTGTDANGCFNIDQVDVTVNPLPFVNAGPDQTVCEGTAVTLNGSGAVLYAWDNGVTDGVPFVPAVGTLTYTVTGTDANGCINTDQIDVTVNPLPGVNAGVDQQACAGSAITLSGSGAVFYAWDNGVTDGVPFGQGIGDVTYSVIGTDANGCVNTDQVDVTMYALPIVDAGVDQTVCEGTAVTLSGSGASNYIWNQGVMDGVPFLPAVGTLTYSVIGTDVNGCSNSDQVDVTVNPLPVVGAGADQTVCEGTAVVLNGSGAVNYLWNNGVTNGVPFTPAVGTLTYSVIGTDANGCQNTDQVDVTVNPLPIVNAGADQTVCEGTAVTLNGSGAVGYDWNNGVIDGVPFIPAVGTLTYTVTGTGVNGCQNTDQVNVTVNPNPVVEAGANQSVCEGTPIVLSAIGTINLYWNNGVTNNVPFQQGLGTVTYTVTDSLSTGCTSTDSLTIAVLQNPIVTTNDAIICEGEGVTLNAFGAVSYAWTGGVVNGVEFFPTVDGSYTVTGTGANGCSAQATANIVVHPAPNVYFNILKISLTTTSATTGFDNLTTGAVSYSWDFGDGSASSTEFEPVHTFPTDQSGEYEITLTAYSEYGCPGIYRKYVHVFLDYTIYVPNAFTPDYDGSNDIFKPVMDGFDENEYTLYIFNRWGELIFESHNIDVGWDGTIRQKVDQVQDGVFTWKIIAGLKESADTKIFVGHVSLLK